VSHSMKHLVLVLLCATAVLASSFTTLQVEPRSQECFYVEPQVGENVQVIFQVIRGGLLDINLRITGPPKSGSTEGNVIYDQLVFFNEAKDEFDGMNMFTADQAGVYSICFDNRMSRYTAKVVSIEITVGDEESLRVEPHAESPEQANLARKGDLDPIEWALSRINSGMMTVEKEQEHYRVREQSHRDLAETTASRVQSFAVGECLVLCVLSAAQIFFVRRWFSKKDERQA